MGLLLVTRGGSLLKHTLGVLLLAWRRIMLASAAAAVAGILIGEIGAVVVTGLIPPPLIAHIVVFIFAAVLAYCTALTVFAEEILHGIVNTIRLVEGDAAAGARAAAVIAEREAGEAGSGIMRLFGRRATPQPASDVTARAFVAPTVDPLRSTEAQQTESDFEATEAFVTTSPRPRVDARPVRADQLPRIGWAASGPQNAGSAEPPAPSPDDASADDGSALGLALPDAPPLVPTDFASEPIAPAESVPESIAPPVNVSAPTPPAPNVPSTPVAPVEAAPAPSASVTPVESEPAAPVTLAPVVPVRTPVDPIPAEPAVPPVTSVAEAQTAEPDAAPDMFAASGASWSPPSSVTVLPPEVAPADTDAGGYGEAARPTRPLSRPNRPLDADSNASSGRGIWSRISQALVGNTSSPSTPLPPDAPAAESDTPSA